MNNEDKIIKLLEALAVEVNDLKSGQNRLESKLDKLELRMENEVIDKVRGLFDAREVQNNVNENVQYTLSRIEGKLDVLQMETASVRRVK